jgi:hypothetical protein
MSSRATADVLKLLADIKTLWDREGFGSDPSVSDPLYERLGEAIAALTEFELLARSLARLPELRTKR